MVSNVAIAGGVNYCGEISRRGRVAARRPDNHRLVTPTSPQASKRSACGNVLLEISVAGENICWSFQSQQCPLNAGIPEISVSERVKDVARVQRRHRRASVGVLLRIMFVMSTDAGVVAAVAKTTWLPEAHHFAQCAGTLLTRPTPAATG